MESLTEQEKIAEQIEKISGIIKLDEKEYYMIDKNTLIKSGIIKLDEKKYYMIDKNTLIKIAQWIVKCVGEEEKCSFPYAGNFGVGERFDEKAECRNEKRQEILKRLCGGQG